MRQHPSVSEGPSAYLRAKGALGQYFLLKFAPQFQVLLFYIQFGLAVIRLTLVFRTCSLNVEEFPHGNVGARQEEVLGLYQGEKSVFLLLTLDFSRARPHVQQAPRNQVFRAEREMERKVEGAGKEATLCLVS